MKIKTLWKRISPLNNSQDMPNAYYIIKKCLAFLLIYGLAALLGEAVVIGALLAMGYDPLNGVLPAGNVAMFLEYYGFIVFLAVAMLYCRVFEKRSIKSMGFNGKVYDYLIGGVAGVVLMGVIVGICCAAGALEFEGVASGVNVPYLLTLFGAFLVQSMAEETMSRGFLFASLKKKVSMPIAVFVSATAFAVPHLSSVFAAGGWYAVVGIVNLYLVSVVFALLYVLRANIYIVSGLHCFWNFVLYGVLGLTVSGGTTTNENALLCFKVPGENILNGGVYGLEAGVITTAVLGVTVMILAVICHKKERT